MMLRQLPSYSHVLKHCSSNLHRDYVASQEEQRKLVPFVILPEVSIAA